jgi:hypothetical protein
MTSRLRDLRYAFRQMRKSPGGYHGTLRFTVRLKEQAGSLDVKTFSARAKWRTP